MRVAQTVLSDCNGVAFAGSFTPVSSVRSDRYQFWSVESGGLMSTLKLCPDSARHERLVWMSGKPAQIPWRGCATVIDLPEGSTLQWRRQGGAALGPGSMPVHCNRVSAPVELHRHSPFKAQFDRAVFSCFVQDLSGLLIEVGR